MWKMSFRLQDDESLPAFWQWYRKFIYCCCNGVHCLLLNSGPVVINRITVEQSQLPICLFHQWVSARALILAFSWFWNLVCHDGIHFCSLTTPWTVELSELLEPSRLWKFGSFVWRLWIESWWWALSSIVLRKSRPLHQMQWERPLISGIEWAVGWEGAGQMANDWHLTWLWYCQ